MSRTLTHMPNGAPHQSTNSPDYRHPIKLFTQANGGNDAFLDQRLLTGLISQRHYLCAHIFHNSTINVLFSHNALRRFIYFIYLFFSPVVDFTVRFYRCAARV